MKLIGIVSGSGIDLTALFDNIMECQSFSELFERPLENLEGHSHCFIHGSCNNLPIIQQSGRFHFYEGLNYEQVVQTVDALYEFGVRTIIMHQLSDALYEFGVRTIIFTNAAGGLLSQMKPGNLVAVDNLKIWPYNQWSDRPDEITPDLIVPGCDLQSSLMWMHGPCYETRAEIAALQCQGIGAVGMSTSPELVRCKELGIRTAVISCITNLCYQPQILTHEHVVQTAQKASERLTKIIRGALKQRFHEKE